MECGFRSVVGSAAHLLRCCSCFIAGSTSSDPPGMTKREAAHAAFTLWGLVKIWYGDDADVMMRSLPVHRREY